MQRTLFVGDVHGCREELELLLEKAGFSSGDRLVFVGDLVNKGPDPKGVVQLARKLGALSVLGNHDARMIGNPRATWGVTEGNPVWEEMREVALMTAPAFLLNVTLNRD
ncbi:MAG: metallophosphoesterase, partial [Deltaproteobacteria bacterium]|nr:metallophosphoesterase [Deltaproteobacteria bacterium]